MLSALANRKILGGTQSLKHAYSRRDRLVPVATADIQQQADLSYDKIMRNVSN